jgi:hypothetical protein
MQSRCFQRMKLRAAVHKVQLVLLKLNQVLFTLTQFIFVLKMEARHIKHCTRNLISSSVLVKYAH